MLADRDGRAASTAGQPGSPIDPQPFRWRISAGRPSATDVWTHTVRRRAGDVGLQQPPASQNQPLELTVVEIRDRRKRINPALEEGLGFEDIAEAGKEALIEQRVGDR